MLCMYTMHIVRNNVETEDKANTPAFSNQNRVKNIIIT